MSLDLRPIVQAVLAEYTLPLEGIHGVDHWARVLENGRSLSAVTGANLEVVSLFAVLHDSRRENESTDPAHGPRAAEYAAALRGALFDLSDDEFALLHRACTGHTHERTHADITIQTCWDSDRLDLGRIGIQPHPTRLCTPHARLSETIKWADGRSVFRVVPDFVRADWGVNLD